MDPGFSKWGANPLSGTNTLVILQCLKNCMKFRKKILHGVGRHHPRLFANGQILSLDPPCEVQLNSESGRGGDPMDPYRKIGHGNRKGAL